jgi:cobalamin biosynthesis Mg chelatase CobN
MPLNCVRPLEQLLNRTLLRNMQETISNAFPGRPGRRGRIMFRRSHQTAALPVSLRAAVFLLVFSHSVNAQEDASLTSNLEQPVASTADASPPTVATSEESSRTDLQVTEGDRRHSPEDRPESTGIQENEKEQLRKSALAGLLVLSLICVVFLILIILVALWARRIRMLTRQPLPKQHPGDPLGYLRKRNKADTVDVAELSEDGSAHGES